MRLMGSDREKRTKARCDPKDRCDLKDPQRRLLLTGLLSFLATPPRIAAASDLRVALEEIAAQFRIDTGTSVTLVFGSSGVLARQIVDGAPFDLFLSADEAYVAEVAAAGRAFDGGTLYAVGRLALFAPHGSPLSVDPQLTGLRALLQSGRRLRFAIANPAHAPYGRAAEATLRSHDLWTSIQPSLVLGENVSQAAQFAASGSAIGGLLAYSLVITPPLVGRGTFALIPESAHAPLRQRMVLTRQAGPTAHRFYRYLQEPAAHAILGRSGFALPSAP